MQSQLLLIEEYFLVTLAKFTNGESFSTVPEQG